MTEANRSNNNLLLKAVAMNIGKVHYFLFNRWGHDGNDGSNIFCAFAEVPLPRKRFCDNEYFTICAQSTLGCRQCYVVTAHAFKQAFRSDRIFISESSRKFETKKKNSQNFFRIIHNCQLNYKLKNVQF